MLSSHGGFLTIAMYHHRETNLIKVTHYDETKKMANDPQIVIAKENLEAIDCTLPVYTDFD